MTGEQTLEHPWLKRKIPPPPPELITTKENLRTFVDTYHNINGIENNVEHIINTKPSVLSAVELIAASDKEFMNRSNVKSFSNDSNKNPLPPVRYPIVVTNNNLPPMMNDNNLEVGNDPSTNDAVLNIMNANIPSMPTPSVLDNASAALPSEPFVPVSEPNLSQFVHVDEIENNNVPVTNPSVEPVPVVKTEDLPINVPLADIPPRVLAAPEVPVASLPFISKSLPAAAAMLDDNMVGQLKPLHIPLIPTLPAPDVVDEPIVVHPPVFSTTLPPPKRGSIDVDSVLSAQKLEELDKVLAKRGSVDIISLLPKRGSIEVGAKMAKRDSIDMEETLPKIQPLEREISPQSPLALCLKPASPVFNVSVPEMVEPISYEPQPDFMHSTNDMLRQLPSKDEVVSMGIVTPNPEIPQAQAEVPATESTLAISQPIKFKESQGVFRIVPSSPEVPVVPVPVPPVLPQRSMEDVFIPQPPAVAKISASPLIAGTSPVGFEQSPASFEHDAVMSETIASTSFHPIRTFSPALQSPKPYVAPETPRSPASPIISNVISPPRRQSPLQKTLDEIPKLSSEILSSLKNMSSLSRTSSYDVSSSKTSFVSKRASSNESSSSYSSHERVTSPRVVSFTEHSTSSFVSSVTPKVYPKIQGITLGKTQTEEKSAFAHVSSRGQSSNVKRTDNKETETSRLSSQRIETRTSKLESSRTETSRSEKASKAEADALAFKQKLRSTAPWFSERKAAENDKNIEKRSTDISALLKENLGPLERSPWAREIRQISAKLVEMSHTTASKKQEEERLQEMNNQQSARRQKFKVSVLNRDVVFGAAREFYIGGEVSGASSPLKEQLLGKHSAQPQTSKSVSTTSTRSPRLSPERKTRSTTFKSSATK